MLTGKLALPISEAEEAVDGVSAVILRQQLLLAEKELETKDAELRACMPRGPGSWTDTTSLQEELSCLNADILRLQENHAADIEAQKRIQAQGLQRGGEFVCQPPLDGNAAQAIVAQEILDACAPALSSGSSSSSAWRQRVIGLEDQLRLKSESITRLRQRELWFEQQIRRQQKSNGEPLAALVQEVLALQECAEELDRGSSSRQSSLIPARPAAFAFQKFPSQKWSNLDGILQDKYGQVQQTL